MANEILNIVSSQEGIELSADVLTQVNSVSQPCRFEVVKDRPENIVLDVCHNLEGFQQVFKQIEA